MSHHCFCIKAFLDREGYRDMILVFGQVLDNDQIFPSDERQRGIYLKRE